MTYLQRVGVPRIEAHTVDLGRRLQDGLLAQGHRLFTPPGNRSSIVTFYPTKAPAEIRAALTAAHLEATVRDGQVRASPALFNTVDDVERFLAVARRMNKS